MSNVGKVPVNIRIPKQLYLAYKGICKKYGYSISGRVRRMIEKDYELIMEEHSDSSSLTIDLIRKKDESWKQLCLENEKLKKEVNKNKD